MKIQRAWLVPFLIGVLIAGGEVYLLLHALLESKPYKVVDPLRVFEHTADFGVPAAFAISVLLTYLLKTQVPSYVLVFVPAISFPLLSWAGYQAIFAASGLDFFSGSGDFSVRQNEMAFAYDLVKVLSIATVAAAFFGTALALIAWLRDRESSATM